MRSTDCDYEIALPLHRLTNFAMGSGYFEGLAPAARREQIDWLRQVYDQLYPTLRLVLYDARRIYSAPITVFGPKLAAIWRFVILPARVSRLPAAPVLPCAAAMLYHMCPWIKS